MELYIQNFNFIITVIHPPKKNKKNHNCSTTQNTTLFYYTDYKDGYAYDLNIYIYIHPGWKFIYELIPFISFLLI